MQENKISASALRHVRTSIAVSICTKFPNLYSKITSDKGYTLNEQETLASELLKALLKLEPSIKPILAYYQ